MSRPRHWTAPEIAALKELDQELTHNERYEQYKAIAIEHGWPIRTMEAVRKRLQVLQKDLNKSGWSNGNHWSARELAHLDDLIGDRPLNMVVDAYNSWATVNGFVWRSYNAIKRKAWRQGLDNTAQGSWVATGIVCRLLRKSNKTIYNWVKRKWIRRSGGLSCQSALYRDDLKRLARKRPHLFGGVPRDDLFWVLEDSDLVDSILAAHPKRWPSKNSTQPVVCITTGRRYESITAAARAHYVDESCVKWSIRTGCATCGYVFRRADARR